ncbi:MAG: serine/threonine protein kinase, partial [Planctomycetes bacterium]|nr:serine/threonine protein kinase [Planctomycetota bacterium]
MAPTDVIASPNPARKGSEHPTVLSGPREGAVLSLPEVHSSPEVVGHVAHYRLVRLLGTGGMGAVWEAVDTRLNRRVALKLLLEGASPVALARFRQEALHAAKLTHPGIVPVHDVGEDRGRHFLVMALVEGTTLSAALRDRQFTYRQQAALIERTARAVHYAHEQGVIHRDLKPANIMVEPTRGSSQSRTTLNARGAPPAPDLDVGEPRVMDFGLAKDVAGDLFLSLPGQALGTPAYMAPEQAAGNSIDAGATADVYGLGAVLYEMLTGRPPFTGETALQVMQAVVEDEPAPPTSVAASVPRDLETICLRCLAKLPARR